MAKTPAEINSIYSERASESRDKAYQSMVKFARLLEYDIDEALTKGRAVEDGGIFHLVLTYPSNQIWLDLTQNENALNEYLNLRYTISGWHKLEQRINAVGDPSCPDEYHFMYKLYKPLKPFVPDPSVNFNLIRRFGENKRW